jgi:hypothetical protein
LKNYFAGSKVKIVKQDRPQNLMPNDCLASSNTMRIFASLIICSSLFLFGCSSERFTQGRGDAGQFILQHAIAYGGHPIATNNLPVVGGDWQYVQDEFGLGVQFPATQFEAVQSFLHSAFGPPSNSAGWAVRDFGVAIYLEMVGSNTVVSVHPPMSDEQQARMWQRISDTIQKNTH